MSYFRPGVNFNSEIAHTRDPPVSLSLHQARLSARRLRVAATCHARAIKASVDSTAVRTSPAPHASPRAPLTAFVRSHAPLSAPDHTCPSAPRHRHRPAAPIASAPVRPLRFHTEPVALNSLHRCRIHHLTSPTLSCVGCRRATRARAPSTPRCLRRRLRRLSRPTPPVSAMSPPLRHSERVAGHPPPPRQ
jgi:hypothetical protein